MQQQSFTAWDWAGGAAREGSFEIERLVSRLLCGGISAFTRGYRSPDLLRLWESEWGAAEKLFIYFLDFLLYCAAADTRSLSLSLSFSLSLFLSLLPPPPYLCSLPLPWLKGNKSAASCITLHRWKSSLVRIFISLSFLLNEMIQFPTAACDDVFCCCGGAALFFLVGRLSCPQALPVGDGDSYQNSCHMKPRPATFHAWISWSSNMPVWNQPWIRLRSSSGCVSFLRFRKHSAHFLKNVIWNGQFLTLASLCCSHFVMAKR